MSDEELAAALRAHSAHIEQERSEWVAYFSPQFEGNPYGSTARAQQLRWATGDKAVDAEIRAEHAWPRPAASGNPATARCDGQMNGEAK